MKRLKKEKWEGRTISDNQRLPTAKMVHAFCRTLQWEVTDGQNSNGILASRLLNLNNS